MGGVPYLIDNSYTRELRELGIISNENALLLTLPIGSIDVAASRETLQYTDSGVEVLKML